MKRFHLLALVVAFSLAAAAWADEGKHLFLLSGQSNMAGLDPRVSFIPAVEKELGADKSIVIKDAQGGQPIRRWYRDWRPAKGELKGTHGDLYERLMAKVKSAIEGQKIASVTFVWMQGERDAKESHGEVYAESFSGIIEQLKKDLGRDEVNFVIGRLGSGQLDGGRYPHWAMIRNAQVKLADNSQRGAWIDTDDCPLKGDKLHYTADGYKMMGQRFAEKAIELIKH